MAAKDEVYYATGRRKTSTARVFLKPGSGNIKINGKESKDYLNNQTAHMIMLQPLHATNTKKNFDAYVTVAGGGISGQAGAIRHGLSRALLLVDGELRPTLKKSGFLTRDSRMVERKKYGRHKARKSTQFSKR